MSGPESTTKDADVHHKTMNFLQDSQYSRDLRLSGPLKTLAPARTFARGHTVVLRALLRLRRHDDVVCDDADVMLFKFMLLVMVFLAALILSFHFSVTI